MGIPYEKVLATESPETQRWVKQRAEELIAEELGLREMRRLRKITQARLSRKLKIGQEGVSRIERRTDLYLSTLRNYVEGLGGKLSMVVEFPGPAACTTGWIGRGTGSNEGWKEGQIQDQIPPRGVRAGVIFSDGSIAS